MTAYAMPPPPVQRLGAAVLVQGAAVADLLALVGLGVRVTGRDGIATPPRVQHLLAALHEAAQQAPSEPGHGDVAARARRAESGACDEVGSARVAAVLGLSRRQAQRLAGDLDARRTPAGELLYRTGAVTAYRAEREERRRTT